MEKSTEIVASYVTEVGEIQKRIHRIKKEIHNSRIERHLVLQKQLEQLIERLEEIRSDMNLRLQEKQEREVKEKELRRREQRELLAFLERITVKFWNYDLNGTIENANIIETNINEMNFSSTEHLEKIPRGNPVVEFILQEGPVPDFEKTIPEIIDVTKGEEKVCFDNWRMGNGFPNLGANNEIIRVADVMNYIAQKYSKTHYLPGLDYWKWVQSYQDYALLPIKEIKKNSVIYFPGSLFLLQNGYLVPYIHTGGSLGPSARFLDGQWEPEWKAILLPKTKES